MKFPSFIQAQHHNKFAELGSTFALRCQPQPLKEPELICSNTELARLFAMHDCNQTEIATIFSGNELPTHWDSIAHRYAGHQFGKFNHFLGDGRCHHLTNLNTDQGFFDICLKGSGKTPFARDLDGRASLTSCVKEFLASAALNALNVPTSQGLFLVKGTNPVSRTGGLQPATVLTRVAPNFIRFGHFEDFYYSNNTEAIKTLADFCVAHFFPQCLSTNNPYEAMLQEIVNNTARLIAHWQSIGFVHGTMNTDNQSIMGITLDHGTCAFLETYHPNFLATDTDEKALFAFDQQPSVGAWNCQVLAQTFESLVEKERIQQVVDSYWSHFENHFLELMRKKLGLAGEHKNDLTLIKDLLTLMAKYELDYTNTLRRLSGISQNTPKKPEISDKDDHRKLSETLVMCLSEQRWLDRYFFRAEQNQTKREKGMNNVNPKLILRQLLIDNAATAALDNDNTLLQKLFDSVCQPF